MKSTSASESPSTIPAVLFNHLPSRFMSRHTKHSLHFISYSSPLNTILIRDGMHRYPNAPIRTPCPTHLFQSPCCIHTLHSEEICPQFCIDNCRAEAVE